MMSAVRKPLRPRQGIYDLYWYFAFERQRIFERRIANEPPPWTDDPVLQSFKFCNVYRAADRVSQYLIRDVAYHAEACTPEDRIFQIVAFRVFSRIQTWRAVRQALGNYPTLDELRDGSFTSALERSKRMNGPLYTGAFILAPARAYGHSIKYLNHIELFRDMFLNHRLADRVLGATSLQEIYELLHEFPLMGDFMSYQIAVDLNYSALVDFSENDFTQPGPGALRGIRKVFESLGDYSPSEAVLWMVERQSEEFAQRGLAFNGLWGRPLQAIDCQGLFCEVDKYAREAVPELKSARKRIKSRFLPCSEPIRFFFPPKWGINETVPDSAVFGTDREELLR